MGNAAEPSALRKHTQPLAIHLDCLSWPLPGPASAAPKLLHLSASCVSAPSIPHHGDRAVIV